MEKRVKAGIWSNAIRIRNKEEEDLSFMEPGEKYLRRVRYFPGLIEQETVSLYLYNNTVTISSARGECYGLIIESAELSVLLLNVWKVIWGISK